MTPPDLSGLETGADARQCPRGPAAPRRLGPEQWVGLGVHGAGCQRLPPPVAGGLSPVPLRGGLVCAQALQPTYHGRQAMCRAPGSVSGHRRPWRRAAARSNPPPPARPPRHPCPCCRLAGWAPWRAISHGWARPLPRHVPTSGLRRRSPSVPLAGPSSGSPCPSHVTSSMPVLTGSGLGRPTCPPESHGDREARPRAGLSLPACPGVSVGSNMRPPDLPAARLPMLVPRAASPVPPRLVGSPPGAR